MATIPTTTGIALTGDFVTTTLNGAISNSATTATIGTGLNIPATNGILQIDYDSTSAIGASNGPETVQYATYTSGTGALTGLTRGADTYTSGVAHANGATVQAGLSALHLNNLTDIIENSAWTSWTPTWTNATIGNGVVRAHYIQLGKLVWFRLSLTFGSTTSFSGQPIFSLPVTSYSYTAGGQNPIIGWAGIFDSGIADYPGSVWWISTTTAQPVVTSYDPTSGTNPSYLKYANVSATVPITFGTNDGFHCEAFYEAA